MAKPSTKSRGTASLLDFEVMPGLNYERIEYMREPNGMFATMQPQQADRNTAIIAKNFVINENGKYQVRRPFNRIFYDAAIVPIGTVGIVASDGTGILFLFHEAGIKWSADGGVNWSDATGPALTGSGAFLLMGWTMWDEDTLLFTTNDGTDVWTLDVGTKVYSEIAASPVAQIITTFGGRVIVSDGSSARLDWSVKNDSTDWTGDGSGNETLRLSAGNVVDNVIGLFPINDTQMLICRTGSVWMATLTGDVDIPFDFAFLYKVNLAAARTLSYSAQGVFALGLDDIFILTESGPKSIGNPVIGRWISSDVVLYNQHQAVGTYEPLKQTYYLFIPYTSESNILLYLRGTDSGDLADHRDTDSGEDRITDWPLTDPTLVLAYNARWNKWTYYSVYLNMQYMTAINFRSPAIRGLVFTTLDNQLFTEYRPDEIMPNDGNDEMDFDNEFIPLEAELLTGVIGLQDNSRNLRIRKIEVDLTTGPSPSTVRRTLMQLYKARSGPGTVPASAIDYSDKTEADEEGRVLHETRKDQAIKTFTQLGLKLQACPGYVLEGIYVYAAIGSEINQ